VLEKSLCTSLVSSALAAVRNEHPWDEMKFKGMSKVWWKGLYQRIITRSRNLGVLLIYHANLWK